MNLNMKPSLERWIVLLVIVLIYKENFLVETETLRDFGKYFIAILLLVGSEGSFTFSVLNKHSWQEKIK